MICLPAFAGCMTTQPETWEVDVSGLDFIQFTYIRDRDANTSPSRRVTRLELLGNGHLSLEVGSASRVEDAFWTRREVPNWHDLRRDNIVLTKAQTTHYFQSLVDAGFFGKDFKKQQADDESRDLLVYSHVGKRRQACATADPDLVRMFRELLKRFQ
jgi:hypothetical protein